MLMMESDEHSGCVARVVELSQSEGTVALEREASESTSMPKI